MDQRRTMVWGGAVVALALVSLGGAATVGSGVVGRATGGSGGCNGEPQTVPDEVPDHIVVAEPAGPPTMVEGPKAADPEQWLVKDMVILELTEQAVTRLNPEAEGGLLWDKEILLDFERLQASNPTFVFHDRDSDLIEHFLDESRKKVVSKEIRGEILPAVERIVAVEVPEGGDIGDLIAGFEALDWVSWAEYGSRLEIASTADLSGYQWNVDTLQTTSAHDIAKGTGVAVAIIDTGIQPFENAFHDLRLDLCLDEVDQDLTCDDPNGHGTHMASIIGQRPIHEGLIGLAPEATLIPVRVADVSGLAYAHQVANGIVYAADQGAQVIAVGLGGYAPSRALEEAVEYAERVGAIVVAPAGNAGIREVMVPARYKPVVSVGAVDMTATVLDYSNDGPKVDVYAPGGALGVDSDGDGLEDGVLAMASFDGTPKPLLREGTSVSTAHVAGTIALGLQIGPDRLPTVYRELLGSTTDPVLRKDGRAAPVGMISPRVMLERLRDLQLGEKEGGEACQRHVECASGVCEGQGCGTDAPGQCAAVQRSCTLDLRPYCGCNDQTFFSSGTCSMDRYQHEGMCEE